MSTDSVWLVILLHADSGTFKQVAGCFSTRDAAERYARHTPSHLVRISELAVAS